MAEDSVVGNAEVMKGENARLSSFVGAIAIADLVKTTLGPKGMDKILQSVGDPNNIKITITNDGATILRSVPVENPAAKVLVEIARIQDETVGDGTTSVTVLCGELLREAEFLINQRVHPMIVIQGWRQAVQVARAALDAAAVDNSSDPVAFREDLLNIASTTLSSKLLNTEKSHFATLAVDAVLRLKGTGTGTGDVSKSMMNLDYIQVIKKPGGTLADSFLEPGFILDKSFGVGQPKRVENAKILIANTPMDTDKIKIYGSRVRVDSMMKVAEIEEAEKQKMRNKCNKIIDHGINVFVNRQLIYNFPEQIFTSKGVVSVEHADFDGIERLAAVTGGEITSTFDKPELVQLGECKLIDEIMIGEEKLMRFSGCKAGHACSVVLRGASSHLLDEAERSLHDALCVLTETLKETRVVCGGGCMEMMMANAIDEQVPKVAGKAALAMESFARALRKLPAIIADNGGYDSSDLVTKLRAAHSSAGKGKEDPDNTKRFTGLDMRTGNIGNMMELGIRESYKSKLQVLISAAEAAEMILRVDDIIKAAPRERDRE
eukprot:TRINITY_DN60624_c0_g2_i1.p1 TRINITY_DN60624_c0_g2~~TRINITY_DN60624_c0_g2_i1.p1  ORF type:complete len:549 (-),score=49.60 TRINITY_DN60624_c0_g2_i1:108-1754(-)